MLVYDAMEKSNIIDKVTVPDGYGGVKTTYKLGAEIMVAYSMDSSTEARIAAQQGVTGLYTVTTEKSINLQFHDVFKRKSDGKIFFIYNKIIYIGMLCRRQKLIHIGKICAFRMLFPVCACIMPK